jgi:aminoglycoside 2'-N-acetyltransferase I
MSVRLTAALEARRSASSPPEYILAVMTESLVIEVHPRAALSPARLAAVVGLCERAYEEPFAETLASFPDATHVLCSVADQLVSHALWVPRLLTTSQRTLHTAYVEAVATEPRWQRRGYASATLRALATHMGAYDVAALSPSDATFYERLGWELWTGPLAVRHAEREIATPDEEVMILRLPASLTLDVSQRLTAPWREGDIW